MVSTIDIASSPVAVVSGVEECMPSGPIDCGRQGSSSTLYMWGTFKSRAITLAAVDRTAAMAACGVGA